MTMSKVEAGFVLVEMMRGNIEAMVDVPDEVKVQVAMVNDNFVMSVEVAPSDVGQVIGKQGRNARALRTILGAAAMKAGVHCDLNLMETGKAAE